MIAPGRPGAQHWTLSDKRGILRLMTEAGIGDKLREALQSGLIILFRLKNHRVDYSIMNRPEPTLTGISDHALATAIVDAGSRFTVKKAGAMKRREKVSRVDGREVTYKETIDIDWDDGIIHSTRGRDLTLKVLSVVVQKLMASAQAQEAAERNKHGAN